MYSSSSCPFVICTHSFLYSCNKYFLPNVLCSPRPKHTQEQKFHHVNLMCDYEALQTFAGWLHTSAGSLLTQLVLLVLKCKVPNLGPHVKARTQNHTYKGFPLIKFNLQYARLSYRECFWNTKQVPPSLSKDCTALKWPRSTPALLPWWYSHSKTSAEDREYANNANSVPHKHEDRCGLWRNGLGKQQEEHVLSYTTSPDPQPGWRKQGELGLREAGWLQGGTQAEKGV